MGAVYVIQGILIYIYAFDHNPPHIHDEIMELWGKAQRGETIKKVQR